MRSFVSIVLFDGEMTVFGFLEYSISVFAFNEDEDNRYVTANVI